MKLRPLIYFCLFALLLSGWLGASIPQQLLLLSAILVVLETTALRPMRRLSERARRLEVYPGTQTIFEISALDRAIGRLESRFDQKLQEAEREKEQIHNLLSALPDPVLHFDKEGKLLYLNPAAEVALELHRQDLIGRSLAAGWTNLLRPPLSAQPRPATVSFDQPGKALLLRVQKATLEGQDSFSIGPQRSYRSLVIPLKSNEQVLLLRDITDLKRLEEVRQLFLGSISHELRTPLTIIKGFTVTLLDDPNLPPSFSKPLNRMDSEADRLTRLVNDLLDLTQIQSQRLSLELVLFDAQEVVEETLGLLHPLAERRGVTVHGNPSKSVQNLYADKDRVKQVIINLVDNAIKFTPSGGSVSVSHQNLDHCWELCVEDSGPGVAASELPSLFEHFFRGKHSRKVTGSGLGLAIVKEIVSLHQGSVEATCPEGRGLKVCVQLPRHNLRTPQGS